MNVSILYNEDAGEGISGQSLRELIERAGHTVLEIVTSDRLKAADGLKRRLDARTDLMVAAGGDGTIATGAGIVAGSSTPLAILPLGTANNIARSLGINASPPELVESWATARRLPFDLAHARAGSHEWLVVEGVGGGLIPSGIAAAQRAQLQESEEKSGATTTPADALQTFYDVLLNLEPRKWTMNIDGRRFSDEFLVVEILNIGSVGPNLVFSPDVTPSDGYLDVILAGSAQRAELLDYLHSRIEGHDTSVSLPSRRAREIQIESGDELHIDDERVDARRLGHMSIRIEPGAITVLA
jgi:diacylglycerol kinase (ATP)